jgi:hypothetical protein
MIYAAFLGVFVFLTTMTGTGSESFYFAGVFKEIFQLEEFSDELVPNCVRNLESVVKLDDIWGFLEGPLGEGVFQTEWYNGELLENDVNNPLVRDVAWHDVFADPALLCLLCQCLCRLTTKN